MRPSSHTYFFSSLKQVEKRLKSENTSQSSINPSPPPPESDFTPPESLSSPIYLNFDQPTTSNSILQESEPPQEFLSSSLDFPATHEDPPQSSPIHNPETINLFETNGVDDIDLLMQLLGLSDCKKEEQEGVGLDLNSNCDDGFYVKIAKVKGPKCKKEVQRLEGWIKHFMNEGERKEPLILAHLLLAKAALLSDNSGGCGGFEFPSTVDEFLQNDPPPN